MACVLLTLAAELIAWHLLVPRLQQRVASGTLAAADAIDSAAASTGGLMLAVLGGALLACTLYNRFARERARRREADARQIAFLTSLGHRLPGRRPSSDRKSQD
ncbi:hypothetical protein [Pseudoxanthomonas spadix]|uniref:hypothetical protein n=1 Tax=Pseudoxanthomonas spadix TaxID=415229 RepID=UPI0011D20D90|nr:hypothetical protein [Pseudoxanthomonas spadix]